MNKLYHALLASCLMVSGAALAMDGADNKAMGMEKGAMDGGMKQENGMMMQKNAMEGKNMKHKSHDMKKDKDAMEGKKMEQGGSMSKDKEHMK